MISTATLVDKSLRQIAASKTIKTFAVVGPLTGNVLFGSGLALKYIYMFSGKFGKMPSGFPLEMVVIMGFAFAMLFIGVGLILCWPVGIGPALIVGTITSEFGLRFGYIPFWLPCGLAALPGLLSFGLADSGNVLGPLCILTIFIVPALVSWLFALEHWKAVAK